MIWGFRLVWFVGFPSVSFWVPAPRRIVCDKPSFSAQHLLAWGCGLCRRCLATSGTEHRVSADPVVMYEFTVV